MPKAANRKERANQILAWLIDEWPPGRKVVLKWRKEIVFKDDDSGKPYHCDGITQRDRRTIIITLSEKKCRRWRDMTTTLIHEFVHAKLWGMASIEFHDRCDDHDISFRSLEAEIVGRWDYDLGNELASEYPVR